jgi:hypothetical protein
MVANHPAQILPACCLAIPAGLSAVGTSCPQSPLQVLKIVNMLLSVDFFVTDSVVKIKK